MNILFLQKNGVLEEQIPTVKKLILRALPASNIRFADALDKIPEGLSVDVVIAPTIDWLPEALDKLEAYQWIHFLSAGVEKIWEMDFSKANVLMSKSSGVHVAPISEYIIGAILYFEKQFNRFIEQSRNSEWQRTWLGGLSGKKLTVLGAGHIGRGLAQRAKAFDMTVVGTSRSATSCQQFDKILTTTEISSELGSTDYLAVTLPFTEETKRLVNKEFLAQLKPGAVLIDASRGGIVCEDAVISALDSGKLRGAALDVFEAEPLPVSSKLWNRPDVLLTPHVSGTTPHYLERAISIFIENARSLEKTGRLVTPVDVKAGY